MSRFDFLSAKPPTDTVVVAQTTATVEINAPVRPVAIDQRDEQNAKLIAAFGVPDALPVVVPEGSMAVACTLRYDGSVPQCDHFDRHAGYGPHFALLVVSSRARTEGIARRALEVSGLSGNWTWHSETHGHGNYLMGPVFELPPELSGFERAGLNGLPVRHVRWQIEFHKPYRSALSLPPFKTYGHGQPAVTVAALQNSSGCPTATLRENRAKQGIEIHFARRPDDATLAPLKAAGWRWSRFGGCWYTRDTQAAREWAKQFLDGVSRATIANPPSPTTSDSAVAEIKPPTPVAPPSKALYTVDGETFDLEADAFSYAKIMSKITGQPTKVLQGSETIAEFKNGTRQDEETHQDEVTEHARGDENWQPGHVVVLDNPPPDGWKESDRVLPPMNMACPPPKPQPAITPQVAPMAGFSMLGLKPKPATLPARKPFLKPVNCRP